MLIILIIVALWITILVSIASEIVINKMCGSTRSEEEKDPIMARVIEHRRILEDKGYEVVFIALQGSQNYGLDEYSEEYQSDVDTKAIVLPQFKDFVYGRQPVSTTIVLDNEEHIDTKDIRVMFDILKKENISYIELLYSKYYWINPKYERLFKPIIDNREKIANANIAQFVRCLAGMSMEKRKALCHPYPGIAAKIQKYGYDGKQLSHCARINEFIERYYNGVSVEDCFKSNKRQELMNYKKEKDIDGNELSVAAAVQICEEMDETTKKYKDVIVKVYEGKVDREAYALLDKVKFEILQKKFIEDLNNLL